MKAYVYLADNYGCGNYRLGWPAKALQRVGCDIEIIMPGDKTGIGGVIRAGKMINVMLPEDADVIVIQRPSRSHLADAVPLIRAKGVAVVVDVDDDLERIHPSNPAFAGMHPANNPENNWTHVRRACRAATMVTCSTWALMQRYGAHGRVRLLPNYIPSAFLGTKHVDSATVGWAGSLHSHPTDLDCAAGAVERLVSEGHDFHVVGPGQGVSEKLGLSEGSFTATGVLPFEDWIPAVAEIGIGIAPLANSSFNESKSWLKCLEYSATGVPWIASDTTEYARLAKLCEAPVLSKAKQWYPALKKMIENEAYRVERSEAAKDAASLLTIEAHAHLWAEAWLDAARMEQRALVTR